MVDPSKVPIPLLALVTVHSSNRTDAPVPRLIPSHNPSCWVELESVVSNVAPRATIGTDIRRDAFGDPPNLGNRKKTAPSTRKVSPTALVEHVAEPANSYGLLQSTTSSNSTAF